MADDVVWDAYARGGSRPRLVASSEAAARPPLVLHPARLPDPTAIPPRQWLYGTQLLRGFVSVLVAPGGTGKSALAMAVALAVATGRPLLGEHVFGQGNVAVINLEDPMEELERRLAALMIRHNVSRDALAGRYFLDDGEERGVVMAEVGDDGFTIVHPDEAALTEQAIANRIDLTVCDPFAESHTLEENSNPQMVRAAKAWRRYARATNSAVLLVHHVRKGDATGIDAARGAKALTDSARVGLLLTTMSDEEADKLSIKPDERWQFVRLDDAKRNMAPAAKARWLKLDQVALQNPSPDYPSGDRVAAIVQWEPPDALAGITHADWNRALDVIAEPPAGWLYSASRRGKANNRWAGQVLIDMFEISEGAAAKMIAQWLKCGTLFEESYRDSVQRKMVPGVRVNPNLRPS